MRIVITPYTEDQVPAVREFNARLRAGGVGEEFCFPESPVPQWLPKIDERRIYQKFFLATEDGCVRGGYILKFQDFFARSEMRPLVYYHLPVSEGIIDKAYVSVGLQMLQNALAAHPLLYCLGMGSYDRPLPRMLRALQWKMCLVPFYFRACSPRRFLREIRPLRERKWFARTADCAAITGAGWAAIRGLQWIRKAHRGQGSGLQVEPIPVFESWADDLWQSSKSSYSMVAVRDSQTLNILYPKQNPRFLRLKISRNGRALGWAVLLDTPMRDHKYFGSLRVGTIADSFATPQDAGLVINAAARILEERGVDLIVSNQLHRSWSHALKKAGFLPARSNFIFAVSTALYALIQPFEATLSSIFMNRGDGDGPVNL